MGKLTLEQEKFTYRIAYYTGTGGTKIVAECMADTLKEQGILTELEVITTGVHIKELTFDRLIILFPVHAFNASDSVYRWIDNLELVDKLQTTVISVSGGGEVFPNKACRISTIRKLERRGYEVTYEKMIVMPSNWVVAIPDSISLMLLDVLPSKVNDIIRDVSSDVRLRSKPNLLNRCFSRMGEIEKPAAKLLGRYIKVDSTCNGCGKCSRSCPADNITMESNRPHFKNTCHLCLRCFYNCPHKALKLRIGKFILLKEGYHLEELRKQLPIIDKVDIEELTKGIMLSGVRKYLLEL